ncbi:MAG: carbonic anhydrase [Prevotella sp.]|nr:carbonic anhydrase [Prevotella sp.]
MIDEILRFNASFVENKGYERFVTSKYPDKKLAILSCMDTRLTELLPAALGLKNGDAKIIKNAGATILQPFDGAVRSLVVAIYELGVEEVMVVAHSSCGACHMNGEEIRAAMEARGIKKDTLEVLRNSGIDLDFWLEGFHDTEESVRKTVATIVNHPLIPADVRVCGFIIDSVTGRLTRIV